MSHLFVTSCGREFFIFAIIFESSSMMIVNMRAFYVVPEINMSTAKSLTVAFELPPCSLTQDLLNFCPYQNPML